MQTTDRAHPATATLNSVMMLPAKATLANVTPLPTTATLVCVTVLPATDADRDVPAQPATATLPVVTPGVVSGQQGGFRKGRCR